MELTIEDVVELIGFARNAVATGQESLDIYGTNELGYSADEAGEDPYYEWVTLYFSDGDDDYTFANTTRYKARVAMMDVIKAIHAQA